MVLLWKWLYPLTVGYPDSQLVRKCRPNQWRKKLQQQVTAVIVPTSPTIYCTHHTNSIRTARAALSRTGYALIAPEMELEPQILKPPNPQIKPLRTPYNTNPPPPPPPPPIWPARASNPPEQHPIDHHPRGSANTTRTQADDTIEADPRRSEDRVERETETLGGLGGEEEEAS